MEASTDISGLNLRITQIQNLFVVRLGTLRQIVLRSAGIAYEREVGLLENEWLMVSYVGMHDRPVPSTEVATALVVDKGQISRVTAGLIEKGLVQRDHARGPLCLSKSGRKAFERIQRLVRERNMALLESISTKDLSAFNRLLDTLFAGARTLAEDERRLAPRTGLLADHQASRPGRGGDVWAANATAAEIAPLIMPDLHVLLRMLRQSATLAYGRVTGLANFDWRTVTHIAIGAPMTLADLIDALDRDKSQVGRAVNRLIALGLAERSRQRGVPSEIVSLTPAGAAAYDAILLEARRRDACLTGELSAQERRVLATVLDRLTQNALALLARVRGAVEPD